MQYRIILIIVLIIAWGCDVSEKQKSNVLFISVDDMNDWISVLGGYKGTVFTPNIDRLAKNGITFTNAHCPSPLCNPSRAAVLTGLRPSTTGVYHNGQWWRPALPDVVTIPEFFRSKGYFVAGAGKIFHHTLGNNPPELWDEFKPQVQDSYWHYNYRYPGQHEAKPGLHWPEGFPLNQIENVALGNKPPGNYREFDWGPLKKKDKETGDGQAIIWAENFLKKSHNKPFFLAIGTYRPHLPWYTPQKYFDLYPLESIRLPDIKENDLNDIGETGKQMANSSRKDFELVLRHDKYKEAVQAYLASISFADALLGNLLDALQESKYAENTIVVLWSDHGWHLGEKHHWHKSTLWERATHVPFILNAPGYNKNIKCNRPVNLIDIYPTLVDLCGFSTEFKLDGLSLVPLLQNPEQKWQPTLTTYRKGNHAIRDERWRYIKYHDGSEELYDHKTDKNEWNNLAVEPGNEDIIQELQKYLPTENAPDAPVKKDWHFDPKTYSWTKK